MSKYTLKAVEGDYEVEVPEGETVLGRGPFLQVRSHDLSPLLVVFLFSLALCKIYFCISCTFCDCTMPGPKVLVVVT